MAMTEIQPISLLFKWMYVCVLCLVTQSCLTLWPHGLQPARLLCPWWFSRQEYRSELPCPPPWDFPNPGIQPRSPALQANSLSSETPGKPKNRVGRLSLLKGIFTTQEPNWGLLHCRWILFQLSYQGSPSLRISQYKSHKLKSKENKDWKKRECPRTVGQLQKV